jgi:hypothetical protein
MVRTILLANARPDDSDTVELAVSPGSSALSARSIFDPATAGLRFVVADGGTASAKGRVRAVVDYYRDPLAVFGFAVSALLLIYVGGMVMFWYHAVLLNEGGPAISWWSHWLLDSTFGFIGLTPALLLIMPIATIAATRGGALNPRAVPWIYSGIAGLLFAVATTPGPVAHDMLVGRGTWLANQVTQVIGDPAAQLAPGAEYPVLIAMTMQFGFAIPLYIGLTAVSVLAVRRVTALRRPAV